MAGGLLVGSDLASALFPQVVCSMSGRQAVSVVSNDSMVSLSFTAHASHITSMWKTMVEMRKLPGYRTHVDPSWVQEWYPSTGRENKTLIVQLPSVPGGSFMSTPLFFAIIMTFPKKEPLKSS